MSEHAYILPLLIHNAPPSLLKTLAQVNQNLYHQVSLKLHQRLKLGSLIAADRYNLENIQYKVHLPPQAGLATLTALSNRSRSAANVTHLALQSSLYLDSMLLASISERYSGLQYLNVAMVKPCLSLSSLFQSCLDLRYLDVRWRNAGKEQDDLHDHLDHPEYAPNLEFIAVSKIHRELNTERLITQLIEQKSRTLKEIVIYNDDTLSVELARRLVKGCPALEKMTLHHCSQISSVILAAENTANWRCTQSRLIRASDLPYEAPKLTL